MQKRRLTNPLREDMSIAEDRFHFMLGKSTADVNYILKRLIKRYLIKQRDLHIALLACKHMIECQEKCMENFRKGKCFCYDITSSVRTR